MDLDGLFAAPLKTFVAERKRLVETLRASGRAKEAKEVQATPRPSVAAWTVNALARRQAPLVRRLAEITGRLQRAQRQPAGAERTDDYAEVLVAHRETLKQLRGRAEEILAESGQIVRPQILESVLRNLRVGVASDETRPTIEGGRLVHDLAERDFVSLLGQPPGSRDAPEAAGPTSEVGGPSGRPSGRIEPVVQDRLARRDREKDDRDGAARAADEARSQARAETERTRARAEAERRIRVLRGKADGARRMLARAESDVAKAREALAQAEGGLQQARLESELAAQEVRSAER